VYNVNNWGSLAGEIGRRQAPNIRKDMIMNTPENWETFATIRASSERAPWWHEVFGGDRAPIKSIFPYRANLSEAPNGPTASAGKPGALVYEMDLQALTPEMRERLVQFIAKRFGQNPAFVEFDLDNEGCPILADDVVVSTTNVGLLLPDAEIITMGDGYTPDPYDYDEEQAARDEEWHNREIICETCGGVLGPEYSTCFCDDEDQ
jgi:hypothetical protein